MNSTKIVIEHGRLKLGVIKSYSQGHVQKFLTERKITWHFVPPRAPHFGGLWEAAVKSFKHHLLRILGNTLLTQEQFETCLIKTEILEIKFCINRGTT